MTETRITVDPAVMGGRPCIRGLRFPVSRLLGLLAAGQTEQEILANHPDLEEADIRAARAFPRPSSRDTRDGWRRHAGMRIKSAGY
ncbi:MAG: DUF433 domain-containing protein [Phycisphaerales bacterium]|nr:DUF433 domain-containing protein [Phycisphaerales bacterium]